jgi:N-acetyltransferase
MSSSVQRTYSSCNQKNQLQRPSSPPSTLSSSPPATPRITKRPLSEISSQENPSLFPPLKQTKDLPKVLSTSSKTKTKTKGQIKAKSNQQKTLTHLHFNIDQTTLRKCPLCDLSYIKGAEDDEALHKTLCTRVQQGMEWGREEEKDGIRDGQSIIVEVENDIKLTGVKEKGRMICLPADVNGKIGTKLTTLLQTINLALSAPPLSNSELQVSKTYLFLLPHDKIAHRDRIIGCIIAQRISTALVIVQIPNPIDNPNPDTTNAHQ